MVDSFHLYNSADVAVCIMNVTLTCSFSSPGSACSLEGMGTQIVPLLACKLDITPHLLSLGVSSGQQRTRDEDLYEVDLILNRAGYFVTTENEKMSMKICPRLGWQKEQHVLVSKSLRATKNYKETALQKGHLVGRNLSISPCHCSHRFG